VTSTRSIPSIRRLQSYLFPTIRAAIELRRNNPSKAIEILKVTKSYEREFDYYRGVGSLHPAYVRARLSQSSAQGKGAAAEFQKI
jgi:hypothetical protein